MTDSPLDNMRKAVERARRQGDGDIGKTASMDVSSDPEADEDSRELLAEVGIFPKEATRRATPLTSDQPIKPIKPEKPEKPVKPEKSDKQPVTPEKTDEPDRPEKSDRPATWASASSSASPPPAKPVRTGNRKVIPNPADIARNRVIAGSSGDERVEPYRQLRSQVLNLMRKHGLKNFAITSAHEDAGKTLTAVNLAIAISLEVNQTVLLVDLDLNSSCVHETFGIEEGPGVIDHLRDGAPLESILLDPGYQRLLLLPGRPVAGNLSELITSPAMKALFTDITTRYSDRIVIFDLPPLLRNDEAMSFLPAVDACLFVVEDDVTSRVQLERSMELLADTKLLGTVLNKVV